jgi:hypothetical protein
MKAMMSALLLGVATSFCLPADLLAQASTQGNDPRQYNDEQVSTVILHDDSLFWQGYNRCDMQGMKTFVADDVEFYHDKGGTTFTADSLLAALKNGLCKDQTQYALRREALAGSVHVYTLRSNGAVYGAIISGQHLFYIKQPGKDEFADGLARFTHLWLFKDGAWKMTRVLSYDHGPAPYINKRQEVSVSEDVLKTYLGKYKGPQSGMGEVILADGHLLLVINTDRVPLFAAGQGVFFVKERDLTFTFGEGKMVVREHGAIAEELIKQ